MTKPKPSTTTATKLKWRHNPSVDCQEATFHPLRLSVEQLSSGEYLATLILRNHNKPITSIKIMAFSFKEACKIAENFLKAMIREAIETYTETLEALVAAKP
jgi:hypothetical protein